MRYAFLIKKTSLSLLNLSLLPTDHFIQRFVSAEQKKKGEKKETAIFGKLQPSFSRIGFEQFFACKPHKASTTAASFLLANLVITLYDFLESIPTDAIPTRLQKITCRIALDDFCSHFQLSHFGTVCKCGHFWGGGGRWWKVYRLPLWSYSILLLMPAG